MKVRSFAFNSAIFITAIFFSMVWVGTYQFFLGSPATSTKNNLVKCPHQTKAVNNFDINDPNSVLPLNYDEANLTSPKTDETNTAYFDPEGYYYLLDDTAVGFEDFKQFNINNKKLDVDPRDRKYGELITPTGSIILMDGQSEGSMIRLEILDISNGKIHFEAKTRNGISYEFDGDFIVKGNFYTLDEDAKVVEGILTKKEYGETVAESPVTFGWGLDF